MVKTTISTLTQRTQPRALTPSLTWLATAAFSGTVAVFFIFSSTASATNNISSSTNNLSLNISAQCSFTTKGSASATNGNYTATGANGNEATFAKSIHTFNITCNQSTGYTVTAYATNLTRINGDVGFTFINYSNYDSTKIAEPNNGIWSASLSNADADAAFGTSDEPLIIKSSNTYSDIDGDEFSVAYHAYIGDTTPAGLYSGQAVYTLAMNPDPPFIPPMADNAIMQNMTAASCQNASSHITYNLIDSRNGKKYLVGKLADGNCWMLQNLYFKDNTTLTSSDSDFETISNYTLPDSTIGGFRAGSHQDATMDSDFNGNNTGSYFSYIVATAGYDPTVATGDAPNSICPKGWKLPTGNDGGQFQSLYASYGNNYNDMRVAFKANYTSSCDVFSDSTCPGAYIDAAWWSSTIQQAANSYAMSMRGAFSSFYAQGAYVPKHFGYSIRCVLVS